MLRPTGESFRLAGYNLIYKAWEERGQPIDQGWHVSAAELIQIDSKDLQTYDTRRMVIDFIPMPGGVSALSSYWTYMLIHGGTTMPGRSFGHL